MRRLNVTILEQNMKKVGSNSVITFTNIFNEIFNMYLLFSKKQTMHVYLTICI